MMVSEWKNREVNTDNLSACLPPYGMAQLTISVSHGTKKGPHDIVLWPFDVNRGGY